MTPTPTRPSFTKRFGLGAIATAFAGGLMALTGAASAQTLTVQVNSSNYDRDNRYGSATSTVYCESEDRRYRTCNLGGNVQRVYLQDRKSNASCHEGRDWGYDRNHIWVRNGCRANFGVVYAVGYNKGYNGGYDRNHRYDNDRYDRYDRYDRPGRGYGRDNVSARRDDAVRSCIAVANHRLNSEGRHGYRFDKVNFATPDRDGYGWTVGLEYDYGHGYRSRERDIVCQYERGRAWLTSYRYSGYDDRGRDRDDRGRRY